MATWKSIPKELPTDTQHVYIRLWNYFNEPIACIYESSGQIFISDIGNIIFPIYTVYRWRPY
jgi:hypothetical protein